MKTYKNYITLLRRSIAYVLLISQLLTSCNTQIPNPQPPNTQLTDGQVPVYAAQEAAAASEQISSDLQILDMQVLLDAVQGPAAASEQSSSNTQSTDLPVLADAAQSPVAASEQSSSNTQSTDLPVLADAAQSPAAVSAPSSSNTQSTDLPVLADAAQSPAAASEPSSLNDFLRRRVADLSQAHHGFWRNINNIHEVRGSNINAAGSDIERPWFANCKNNCMALYCKTGIKPMKLFLLAGICPALLCMTSIPYWYGFQIDDTDCQHPSRSCKIVTSSFSFTTIPPITLSEDLNSSNQSLLFYHEKEKALRRAWYQQHPCAEELIQEANMSATDLTNIFYKENTTRLARYLDCAQEQGQARSNTTVSLLEYIATKSREITEQGDPKLDPEINTMRRLINEDVTMQLGELHRLQANDMGENIQMTKSFDEQIEAGIKQTTINVVSMLSLTWHVVARLFAFSSVIYFSKIFLKQGSILKTVQGAESTPKTLRYNTTLFHSVPLCLTGSLIAFGLCGYLNDREMFSSKYTLTPSASVILDTLMLQCAFWAMYNIELASHIYVERFFAVLSLVSTPIWFSALLQPLKVVIEEVPLNCNEPGSLATLAIKHNSFLNMLQVITSNGFTEKILEMVMPDLGAKLQQAAVHNTQLPNWCTETNNDRLKEDLLTNAKIVLYLYLLSIYINELHIVWKGYTHNSFISYSKFIWLARCLLSYNQVSLNFPFLNVSRSLPLPGFLESMTMAILLASSVLIPAEKVIVQEQDVTAQDVTEQDQNEIMYLADSQRTVMGFANSMRSSVSSMGSRLSDMKYRTSDRFQRMLSGF